MKKYATTYILTLSLLIGELHTYWEKGVQHVQNWIIARDVPMSIQWNVKLATDQLNYILYFIAAFYYGKTLNLVNKSTVLSFIALSVIDTCMYFYNYKTYGFGIVYILYVCLWIIIFYYLSWKKKKGL